ncbi:MAG: PAS domain-containing protein [Solirubrobacteraceae bacterium]
MSARDYHISNPPFSSDSPPSAAVDGEAGRPAPDAEIVGAILDALPAMVGYWDTHLRNRAANRAYLAFFGMAPEEIRGRHISELLGPELYELNRPYLERALAGEPQLFDRTLIDVSGEPRHTQASYIPDVDNGGVRGLVVLVTDITEHKRAQDELRESREQLAEAERVARIGSWEWDITSDRVTWSNGLFALYGLERDDFDGTFEGARQRVYPDDTARFTQALQRAIAERSAFTVEFRTILPSGRVRTLRSHGEVVVDDAGVPMRLVGIVQDVTDARRAQEALHSTSADLERRAAELQRLALRTATEPPQGRYTPLTDRQLEIIGLVAQGLTNAEIGERLVVTEATIKWHLKQILAKTNSTNRAEAVARVLGTAG